MSIATKTGDGGETGLLFGRRVPKTHPRIEANGAVDELNASLGCARALVVEPFIRDAIFSIQKELVVLMGELALETADHARYLAKGHHFLDAPMVDRLTALIDDLEKNHALSFSEWATPGSSPSSAALDLACRVCRRAEREVLRLAAEVPVNPEIVRYLNRLSDLLWLQARWFESRPATA